MSEGGIVLADGRLVRSYTDLVLPDLGATRAFERTYDNGRNEPSPLGTGWSHNFEGSIYESMPGSYQVVLGGQGYDFPTCDVAKDAKMRVTKVENCTNDKAHAGKLDVNVTPHATDPAQYERWTATFTDDAGAVYTFDREAADSSGPGRRRLLLTEIDDGIAGKPLELNYTNNDDHVDTVTRSGSWTLTFNYAEVPEGTATSRLPIPISTTRQSIPRLTSVVTAAATIKFDHDLDVGAAFQRGHRQGIGFLAGRGAHGPQPHLAAGTRRRQGGHQLAGKDVEDGAVAAEPGLTVQQGFDHRPAQ